MFQQLNSLLLSQISYTAILSNDIKLSRSFVFLRYPVVIQTSTCLKREKLLQSNRVMLHVILWYLDPQMRFSKIKVKIK